MDIFKGEYFTLYTDKNGKFWLWDEENKCNYAIKCNSEIGAYRKAVDMLIFTVGLHKGHRKEAEGKLEILESAFNKAFPDDTEDYLF